MSDDFKIYTAEEIAEMLDTWANFNGFSGETCGTCKKTANVFAYGPGWFCECGAYNVQSFSYAQLVHEKPDLGTPREAIVAGYNLSKKWQRIMAELSERNEP